MLRSDAQVALHDLLEALREAADVYGDDAEALEEGDLAQLCRQLALRRERLADAVATEIRRYGDLPTEPDADRETLHRLGNRLRTLFSQHERSSVLRERMDAEAALARLAEGALGQLDDQASRELVEQVRRDAAEAEQALAAAAPG